MNDHVGIDRDTLRSALVKSGVRMTEDVLDTLWVALGGEPPYLAGRVYQDARGVHWYRQNFPGPPWRECRSGMTYSETGPSRPMMLCGPVPTRQQVAAIVNDVNEYGNSVSDFDAGQVRLTDRIMALLKGETP